MENELSGHAKVCAALVDFGKDHTFFDCDDAKDLLSHQDPGEALEEHISNLLEPGDKAADVEGKILGVEVFDLFAFTRGTIDESEIELQAENCADNARDEWQDEHGDPDGDCRLVVTPECKAAFEHAVRLLYATQPVWRCDQDNESLSLDAEDVLAWARVERPELFE